MSSLARVVRRPAIGCICAGLTTLVIGTFLPWLESGLVSRNSYQAAGALGSLVHQDGVTRAILSGWPFVSAACAVGAALILLSHPFFGAVVASAASLAAGAVAIRVLAIDSRGLVRAAASGPVVTLAGAAVAFCAATITVILLVRSPGGSVDRTVRPELGQ